eukprot:gene940-9848_t
MNEEDKIEYKKWTDFGLDDKILYAIKKTLNFYEPTGIQRSVITEALNGKDILAKSATGTGKTAAVLIPTIQKILHSNEDEILSIYLVPSNELGEQINEHFKDLSFYCSKKVSSFHLTESIDKKERKQKLREKPKMIITTPFQLLSSLEKKELNLETVQTIIIDEADFLLSEGNLSSIEKLKTKYLKKVIFQCMMISATLDTELKNSSLLHDPIIIEDKSKPDVFQYFINCKNQMSDGMKVEKMLRLNFLVQFVFKGGKILIFVEQAKTAYSLLILFNQLLIDDVAVLNDSYPILSRSDIIEKFNTDKIRVLITNQDPEFMEKTSQKKKIQEEVDFENFSISRGIDFNRVSAVINYDIPPSFEEYIHRIGRTARSNQIGIAITFLSNYQRVDEEDVEKEEIWTQILDHSEEKNIEINEYNLDPENIESFRYRIVGIESEIKGQLKNVQLTSIANEIKNSNRIKNKWDSKKTLKHDFLKKSDDELLPYYLAPKNEQTDEKLKKAGLLKNLKRRIENEEDEKKEEFAKVNQQKKKRKIDPLKKLF